MVGGPDNGGAGTEVCEEVTLLLLLLLLPEGLIGKLDLSERGLRRPIEHA